ncbi:hypothetical protein C4564_00575 [Candidatus Microgenomates bacterium]|nr:MAG: hypothetical protein C4564_00575 [Candidatus Microgenomates bacterium]
MNILAILVLWRIGLFAISATVARYFKFTPQFPYSDIYLLPSNLPQFIWGFANFDGVHYLTIAKSGYMAQFTQAFFPLYPLLVRILGLIIKDQTFIVSGLLLSFACFVVAVYFFKRLLLLDYKHSVVFWSLVFLLAFPTGFYFATVYGESLFFLLTVLVFWFARKRKWWLAGIFGFFAALTRINGILLLPVILIEWLVLERHVTSWATFKKSVKESLWSLLKNPAMYLVPLGLITYMVYLKYAFGDPLFFWHAQEVFGAQRSVAIVLPPQVVWRYFKIIATVEAFSYPFWTAIWEIGAFALGVVALLFGHRKHVRLSYLLFGWGMLLLPTLTGTFSSLPRYVLLIFPLFIALALIKNMTTRLALLIVSIGLQLLFLSHYLRGLWVA